MSNDGMTKEIRLKNLLGSLGALWLNQFCESMHDGTPKINCREQKELAIQAPMTDKASNHLIEFIPAGMLALLLTPVVRCVGFASRGYIEVFFGTLDRAPKITHWTWFLIDTPFGVGLTGLILLMSGVITVAGLSFEKRIICSHRLGRLGWSLISVLITVFLFFYFILLPIAQLLDPVEQR